MKKLVALAFALAFTTGQAEAVKLPEGTKLNYTLLGGIEETYTLTKSNPDTGHCFEGNWGSVCLEYETFQEIRVTKPNNEILSEPGQIRTSGILSGVKNNNYEPWKTYFSNSNHSSEGRHSLKTNVGACMKNVAGKHYFVTCIIAIGIGDVVNKLLRVKVDKTTSVPVDQKIWRIGVDDVKEIQHRRIILPQ